MSSHTSDQSANEHVRDEGNKTLSRRTLVRGAVAAPLAAYAGTLLASAASASPGPATGPHFIRNASKTKISFWSHTHPPMIAQNKKMIAEFMQANPDIEVDYQIIPNNDFATKMLTSMGTGTGPDLINMDDNQMRSIYIPKGLVTEVDPKAIGYDSLDALKAAYIPNALEGATVDGKVYGLTSEFNVTAAVINTEAFTESGLDPKAPPATWQDVGTQGQKLVKKDGDQVVRRGFDFLYLHAGWYHNQLGTLLLQTGGRLVSEDGKQATINQPAGVQALQIWYDMIYKYKVADPTIAGRDATVPYQDFVDGKLAMSLFNPWGMAQITKDSAVYDKWAIVPLPQVDATKPSSPFYAYYWSVNSKSKNKEAAFKLAGYFASKPGEWLKNVNFIQPKVGWDTSPAAKEFPFYSVWANQMKSGHFLPVTPHADEIDNAMKSAIESSVLNQVEPQQALDQAAQQINQILQSS